MIIDPHTLQQIVSFVKAICNNESSYKDVFSKDPNCLERLSDLLVGKFSKGFLWKIISSEEFQIEYNKK